MFRVGDKVMCIDDSAGLVKHRMYTVAHIRTTSDGRELIYVQSTSPEHGGGIFSFRFKLVKEKSKRKLPEWF